MGLAAFALALGCAAVMVSIGGGVAAESDHRRAVADEAQIPLPATWDRLQASQLAELADGEGASLVAMFTSGSRVLNERLESERAERFSIAGAPLAVEDGRVPVGYRHERLAVAANVDLVNHYNDGFNRFNAFGLGGRPGFDRSSFLFQPGRGRVFGFASVIDSAQTVGVDVGVIDVMLDGVSLSELVERSDVSVHEVEHIPNSRVAGHRTTLAVRLPNGEEQVVAVQATLEPGSTSMLVVVIGCDDQCFEVNRSSIESVLDATASA